MPTASFPLSGAWPRPGSREFPSYSPDITPTITCVWAGDSRWRINHTVSLAVDSLEGDLYGNGLADPKRYDEIYQKRLLLDLIERRIEEDHRQEIREVFKMLRQGYTWEEVAQRLGNQKPEALKKRFWRWMKRNFPQKSQQKPLHTGRRHMP